MDEPNRSVKLRGRVQTIIPPVAGSKPELVQILLSGCEELYREIRFENKLQDGSGSPLCVKVGAKVEITIEVEASGLMPQRVAVL
jgi:hypothetical protein